MITKSNELINLLGIFLLIFSFSGCKKSSEPNHYIISDEMKQWYLYQKGSYWVFQNDKTSKIDCTYISKNPNFWQENFRKDDGSKYSIKDHLDITNNGNVFQSCNITSELILITIQEYQHNYAFDNHILEGQKSVISKYIIFEYLHHFDNYAIDTLFFQDVRQTSFSFAMNDNGTDTVAFTYFFARHNGLIKLTKSIAGIDTTWNLIRYHPIQ